MLPGEEDNHHDISLYIYTRSVTSPIDDGFSGQYSDGEDRFVPALSIRGLKSIIGTGSPLVKRSERGCDATTGCYRW